MKGGIYSQINEYMNIYDNPMSRSCTDRCPRSLRFNIFKRLFLKRKKPFEAKLHIEPPLGVGSQMCSNILGHMTKIASRPIYGKNLQKLGQNQEANDLET